MEGQTPRRIDTVEVSFLDPLGAAANASFIARDLVANPRLDIRFHIFNARGESRVVTHHTVSALAPPALSQWLVLPARAQR